MCCSIYVVSERLKKKKQSITLFVFAGGRITTQRVTLRSTTGTRRDRLHLLLLESRVATEALAHAIAVGVELLHGRGRTAAAGASALGLG